MLKSAFVIGLLATTSVWVPARAAEAMACTDANMATMQDSVAKMTDAAKKAEAVKEMAMAKDSMSKKDDKGCMDHMGKLVTMMPE